MKNDKGDYKSVVTFSYRRNVTRAAPPEGLIAVTF